MAGLRALMGEGGPLASLVAQVIERTEYRSRLEIEDIGVDVAGSRAQPQRARGRRGGL